MSRPLEPLPIDDQLPTIVDALSAHRAVVVVAAPGAGKTTRIPPALVQSGPVLLLQPRRAAARALAVRIAAEREWTVGREIGWHVRFDKRMSRDTRLIVATEGILTARLQQDPLLSDFTTVILDEFHERSIHTDLGLALTRQAWRARTDLRIVVMSATMDATPVSEFLDGCPIVAAEGRVFPIAIDYSPDTTVADAAADMYHQTAGNLLCFVAGAADAERAAGDLRTRLGGVEVLPLYGSLDADTQDRALAASRSGVRRIVIATNIAETSVTVPGVTAVIDSGYQKIARYDHARGIDSLRLERVTQDSADQRAGRAGRTAPGRVRRLWASTDRLRSSREPELQRVDLAGALLDLFAYGEHPDRFDWFEAPRPMDVARATSLLERLGAITNGRLTPVGDQMRAIPLVPRLARMFVAGHRVRDVARACAWLSEGVPIRRGGVATVSDLISALDGWSEQAFRLAPIVSQLERILPSSVSSDEAAFREAVLAGFPDRVAQRREARSDRFRLSTGAGAVLSRESGVHDAEFVVAVELTTSPRVDAPDAMIRVASAIEATWLKPTHTADRTWVDDGGVARSMRQVCYDEIVLSEHPTRLDHERAGALLAQAWLARPRTPGDQQLLWRLAFSGQAVSEAELVDTAALGKKALSELVLADALNYEQRRLLDREAPETLVVPSGRAMRLEYQADGSVVMSVKLQEMFGLADTPRLGPTRVPVTISLLAPNGRPVQVTQDLRSFWARTYPEVRKELRGRYPKHPWPEDPWSAPPTARTTRRMNQP